MQGFRTSSETKKDLTRVAAHYGFLPGPFVACLVERFIETHDKYQGGMVWPPKYLHLSDLISEAYPEQKRLFEEAARRSEEESRLSAEAHRKAAEKTPGQISGKRRCYISGI